MINLSDKNILICSDLKKERVMLFNYFDENEAEMIYSAKDYQGCKDIIESEKIDFFIIDFSEKQIDNPKMLNGLLHQGKKMKTILLVPKEMKLTNDVYRDFSSVVDVILFEPLSELEISVKLSGSEKNPLHKEESIPKQIQIPEKTQDSNTETSSTEIWNALFNDSIQPKLVVNSNNQKITKVNEALTDLLNLNSEEVINQDWKYFDAAENHDKYERYIREVNSNDVTRFISVFNKNGDKQNLEFEYQLSVLEGEIVFLGNLSLEKIKGVSDDVYKSINVIQKSNIFSSKFSTILEIIRSSIQMDFLVFFEYQNKKLKRPTISGNRKLAASVLKNSLELILKSVGNQECLELDENNCQSTAYQPILDENNLKELCVYPICHQNNRYGLLIAGGQSEHFDWKTITVVLKALVSHCRFNLFKRSIEDQRELDGQFDQLTRLPNRSAMTNAFAKFIKEGVSSNNYLSIVLIEIENLSSLNKIIGIELTDEILLNLSQVMCKAIGKKGQVYRLSGDEFLVMLHPHQQKKLVEYKVDELQQQLKHPILLSNGEETNINYNIGISIFPDDGQTVSNMMKNADLAMYDAKLAGKNNYIIFKHSETGKAYKQKSKMEENLRKAIENGHIHAFFQPKINALTEDVIGFEALVRWIDPEEGMVNPGQFIPLAEETGLINEIGEIVAKQSCDMIVEWQKKYGLQLFCSINLSVIQLMDSKLPQILSKIIDDSGVHPHFVDFEITETISLDVVPNLVELLDQIVSLGCTLSIDDFGTGHSSLDYVKRIPAQYIKIDQSFVKNIGLNPEDEAILDATINIAKRLNRKIIAEGVETEEQREYLVDREVEYFQGFLFSRPLPVKDVEVLLAKRVELMGSS